jgi:hypothetical protein
MTTTIKAMTKPQQWSGTPSSCCNANSVDATVDASSHRHVVAAAGASATSSSASEPVSGISMNEAPAAQCHPSPSES